MTRLMCSEHPEEAGAIKSELFKAGIRSEIRQNPVAAALQITRLELWLENENDYFRAYKLYTEMQDRAKNGEIPPASGASPGTSVAGNEPSTQGQGAKSERSAALEVRNGGKPAGDLEEASLLLEREIEEILEREDALSRNCAALQTEVETLRRSFSESQAVAEKAAAESAAQKSSLEHDLAERSRSEAQLKAESRDFQAKLKSAEEALTERQRKLDTALQQFQNQQATVVQLRKEVVAREQDLEDHKRLLSKAQAEIAVERQSRTEAEQKAGTLALARERLEQQLVEQRALQDQLRASVGNLNSLRDRLHAKRNSVRVE